MLLVLAFHFVTHVHAIHHQQQRKAQSRYTAYQQAPLGTGLNAQIQHAVRPAAQKQQDNDDDALVGCHAAKIGSAQMQKELNRLFWAC